MPFANKYQFTMRIPAAGSRWGDFEVLTCEVGHVEHDGVIDYPWSMVLAGPGGVAGVRRALREHLDHGRTTFSGFGNPYQLRLGRVEVKSLGTRRYSVTGLGLGVRVDLERELSRFVAYARLRRKAPSAALVAGYLEDYKRDVTRRTPELEY